ncbi:hypothetical protein HPP92_003674 [Vanilla planifolia]|uniref:Uncharacterized protein n=1 Tax=Vanilla planifolia TaxID=51239 RepID=A0A835VLQ1_VANPL|nr:hypothetical protein HPP92_003674 [Vanilla planifolia]
MVAKLIQIPPSFGSFKPLAGPSADLSILRRISSNAGPRTLFGSHRRPAQVQRTFSRVWGRGCSGLGRESFDFFVVGATSDGGSGGGDDFGGRGNGGGGGEETGGGDWSFLSRYLVLLDKHPVATKAVTSAVLTLIGDLVCQLVVDHVPDLDVKRTFVFTLLGLVLVGPALHFWYLSLSKVVKFPGVSGAVMRLLLDQFFFSPIFIGVFLCALVTLEGRPSQVIPKLRQEWLSSVLANWQLWIPFQFLNFHFVPQNFQVLAANIVALAWNVILSFKAHRELVVR